GVLLQHRHPHPLAGEQQAQHHPGRPAADDRARRGLAPHRASSGPLEGFITGGARRTPRRPASATAGRADRQGNMNRASRREASHSPPSAMTTRYASDASRPHSSRHSASPRSSSTAWYSGVSLTTTSSTAG